MHEITYRKELDGIRAIAVVSVILFHVGFPSMPGGFVGVDVFFVLSGYLICGQTYLRLAEGRYSATEFFARRIRRLSTAYFVCFLVTAVVGSVLFLQQDMPSLFRNLLGSTTFTNNYNLLFSQGYFNTDAHQNPFLHTWSLSIEEQFYILLPILILLTRRSVRAFQRLLVAMFVVSLAVTLFSGQSIYFKDQRFFASSFRVWELALGGLVFIAQQRKGGIAVLERLQALRIGPLIGLALILVPVGYLDDSYLYPGWVTLAPVFGTALLVATAYPGVNWAGRALASRGMAYVGRISYGAYLWHWPLIVFVSYVWGSLHDELRAVLVLTSLGLGAVSHHLIETPVRRIDVKVHKARLYKIFAVQTGILLLVVAVLAHLAQRPVSEQDKALQVIKDQIAAVHPKWDECWSQLEPADYCVLGDKVDGPVEFLAWGDSMANSAWWAFDDYARDTGRRGALATAASCAPLAEMSRDYGGSEYCIRFNRRVLEYLRDAPPMEVILFSRWVYYGEGFHSQRTTSRNKVALVDIEGNPLPGENFEIFKPGFEAILDEIGQRHKVTVINLWPVVPYSVPVMLLREARFGSMSDPVTLEAYEARNGRVVDFVREAVQARGMGLIEPHRSLCASGECLLAKDGVPLYVDQTHLSYKGNEILRDLLLEHHREGAN